MGARGPVGDTRRRSPDGGETARPAEVGIVLGGGPERLAAAVVLWRRGRVHTLLLSGGLATEGRESQAQIMARQAVAMGVPATALWMDTTSRSTWENAWRTRENLVSRGVRSALVISSDYHLPRVRYVFDQVYRGSAIALAYAGTGTPVGGPDTRARRWLVEALKYRINAMQVRCARRGRRDGPRDALPPAP